MTDQQVIERFNAGKTYSDIATEFRTTRNAIAGRCRRLGLRRSDQPQIDPDDQRDIDMLCDMDEGHTRAAVANHWGVSLTHLQKLISEARTA